MVLIDSLPGRAVTVPLGIFALLLFIVWLRNRAADARIRKAGGIRAPVIASNLISGIKLYIQIGRHQYRNDLPGWIRKTLDSNIPAGNRHCVEFSVTGQKRVLITRDPEQIKTILTTKFASFGHGPQWHKLWRPFLGDGIFATDGQAWHDSRTIIRPMFIKDRVKDLAIFDGCTKKLLSKLPPSGQTVDVKSLLYRWTLDTTTEFLLGECVNSLDNPQNEFADALNLAQRVQMYIFALNPIAPLIPKGEYLRAIGKMEQFMEQYIQRAIALPDSELEQLSKSDEDFTFLHSVARHSKDPRVVRDQVMSVLLAGRDTTAGTLSWALYELCGNPEAWRRMRREVLDVVGEDATPSYETLKDMRYLRHVLDETLRLHPAVAINMRQALETTTIPGPVPGGPELTMLKGDTVTIDTLGMHMRRDLYPPTSAEFADPASFSPERWDKWRPTPWTYTPFHGGPRICLGQNFALTEMAFCLVRLAQRYERVEYRGDWSAQRLRADIIGQPAYDVNVALFEPRE